MTACWTLGLFSSIVLLLVANGLCERLPHGLVHVPVYRLCIVSCHNMSGYIHVCALPACLFACTQWEALLELDGIQVTMVDEIDHHIEGKILGLSIALREQLLIQTEALGQ